jgi:Flp pilus assembly protein TadD
MEGIGKIREVAERDSTNIYAQLTLAKGSIISGEFDKAINRLEIVNRLKPDNLEPIMLMADLYERLGEKQKAVIWYQKSLLYIKRQDIRSEIEKRIESLN